MSAHIFLLLNTYFLDNILPMKTYETTIQHIKIADNIEGSILDIGGGGEGVIGRAYGQKVIAIDNRQDELDEAPSECKKILMDAANLQFDNQSFDSITSFFTMMYIPRDFHMQVLDEAYRVLKAGGIIYLWDAVIPENTENYQVFIIHLNIHLQNENITTGYGVGYRQQDCSYYQQLLSDAGFKIEHIESNDKTYKIKAVKG